MAEEIQKKKFGFLLPRGLLKGRQVWLPSKERFPDLGKATRFYYNHYHERFLKFSERTICFINLPYTPNQDESRLRADNPYILRQWIQEPGSLEPYIEKAEGYLLDEFSSLDALKREIIEQLSKGIAQYHLRPGMAFKLDLPLQSHLEELADEIL